MSAAPPSSRTDGPPASAPPDSGTVTIGPDGATTATSVGTPGVPARIGRFEVRRLLGEGSYGRVYEAFDPTLQRLVALKVARPERLVNEPTVERFHREARAAGLLMH